MARFWKRFDKFLKHNETIVLVECLMVWQEGKFHRFQYIPGSVINTSMGAKMIAELLGPMAEIAVFSKEGGGPVEIHNALSFRHQDMKLGGKGLERETLTNGVEVKSVVVEWGDMLLRIRLDLTAAMGLQRQIEQLFGAAKEEALEDQLDRYLREQQLTLAGMNRSQKRECVQHLHKSGALAYRKAPQEIARRLKISRATLYNYIGDESN